MKQEQKLYIKQEEGIHFLTKRKVTFVYITNGVEKSQFGYAENLGELFLVESRAKREIEKFYERQGQK